MKEKRISWKLWAAGGAAVLLVALALWFALSGGSEIDVLEKYFSAMYTQDGGGIDGLMNCLAPKLREEYYEKITMGGTSFHQMGVWQLEAAELVGDNASVQVELLSTGEDSASVLSQLRADYPGAEQAHSITFRLTLSGDKDTASYQGIMPMIRIDGQWYMLNVNPGLQRENESNQGEES